MGLGKACSLEQAYYRIDCNFMNAWMSISCEHLVQAVTVHICTLFYISTTPDLSPAGPITTMRRIREAIQVCGAIQARQPPSQEQKPSKAGIVPELQILTSASTSIKMDVLARHGRHCPGNNLHGGERAVGPPALKCSIGRVAEIAAPQTQQ